MLTSIVNTIKSISRVTKIILISNTKKLGTIQMNRISGNHISQNVLTTIPPTLKTKNR